MTQIIVTEATIWANTETRESTIKAIRSALKRRSGKCWSVTGGTGTAYGWLKIDTLPARRENKETRDQDRIELAKLMGYSEPKFPDYISVPSSGAHYREYLCRAEGIEPFKIAEAYWD